MASALYPLAKQALLAQNPSIDLDADDIMFSLGRTSAYTYSGTHQYKSSVTTVVDADAYQTSKTTTNGVYDAADDTFTAVPAGAALDFGLVWKDTGNPATSPVIAYIDGFSVTPNGGNITAEWNASGIFAL